RARGRVCGCRTFLTDQCARRLAHQSHLAGPPRSDGWHDVPAPQGLIPSLDGITCQRKPTDPPMVDRSVSCSQPYRDIVADRSMVNGHEGGLPTEAGPTSRNAVIASSP